ncbi:MAG TPA: TetR/AcrR family transcriptional regulator [Polyangiales bacterium]
MEMKRTTAKPALGAPRARVKLDGRHARAEKNRVAVIEALLALLRAGQLAPSTQEIAKRAGVTQRTLFNLFDDVPALLAAVGDYQLAHARTRLPPLPHSGDLEVRVTRYVEELSGFLEELAPVRWAALSYSGAPREARRGVDRMRKLTNDRLAALLSSCGVDLGADPELAQALESALDATTWRLLRTQQGLSLARARRVLVRTSLALLCNASRPKSNEA